MNILIIENQPVVRDHLTRVITAMQFNHECVDSGETALQLMSEKNIDMVILNLEMPGLDGLETTLLIRETLEPRWIPIIFITGKNDDQKVLEGIDAGGDDYLIHPFSDSILKAKIIALQRIASMQQNLEALVGELVELSEKDGLTQLLNRRAFTEKAKQSLNHSERQRHSCALIMLDIDHFKLYNDNYGHAEGDQCLKMVADCLKRSIHRKSDLLGRYGGEEFIIFLPEASLDAAQVVAERLLTNVRKAALPHQASLVSDHVSISIGISTSEPGSTLDKLILAADKNLYQAKRNGRNRYVCDVAGQHKTILIADKNKADQSLLSTLLKPLANIITTESTDDCLELLETLKPELLLINQDDRLDQQILLIEHIEKQTKNTKTQLGYISHHANTDSKTISISKPINTENMIHRITKLLESGSDENY